jgi:hypothetical protein
MGKETFGVDLIERVDEELRPLVGNFACTVRRNAEGGRCEVRFLNRFVWIDWSFKSVIDTDTALEFLARRLRSSILEVIAGLSQGELIMLKYLTGDLPSDVVAVAIPDQQGRRRHAIRTSEDGLVIELDEARVRDGFIEWGYGENRLFVTEIQREPDGVLAQ